ncbi:vWA domain-containing protein [Paenibacillus alginolyticus]|uniref:VWA domain-containing protein n=1 Tax=Paenibacillus alginolyticus TaxID=59839 RepID=A0ABT4GNE0_9BACL|nr:hypothetical protein [Paenibacillus alginolyticus]MCY9697738.1 hypothetical protein [Paenibacillus alginolyticus]MEC0147347.1 hypothetical protein [Paenibacillus alginolyticus]
MIIRCTRVDRYVFEGYVHSSRVAQEWMREAVRQAPWFTLELFADFFMCFYLTKPEVDGTIEETPFHRWMVLTLRKQYFYVSIHPRTIGQVNASFKTALKALMWLTESYEKEVKRRQKEQQISGFGFEKKQQMSGQEEKSVSERLSEKQIEKLRLVGYTLQQGKRAVEDKQEAVDSRPLVAEEIRALKRRIAELQSEMRTEFMKRDKLKAKLRKAEEELERRERQLDRMSTRDLAAMREIEAELGDWLGQALKETLSLEEADSFNVHELVQASQRLANRRWGSELGKLRRQTFEHYVQWIEKLKRSKDLVSFLQEVGRNIHHLRVQRKKLRSPYVPEAYDDLRQSGDIAHLLPSEASLLADEDFEPYFLVKWMENKLMTYNYTGSIEEPQKGPVICMLDTSHSMRGSKLRLAQLFTATFASFSLLERRDFVLLLFEAKGELIEHVLSYKRPDWDRFYGLAQLAFGGGTNFDAPLSRGMDIVQHERQFHDADFVMVTDGVGQISKATLQKLSALGQKKQLRLHSLIIGSARQHLVQKYEIVGVSHQVRFATAWDVQDPVKDELLLDVFAKR